MKLVRGIVGRGACRVGRSVVVAAAMVCAAWTAANEPVVQGQLVIDGVPPVPEELTARLNEYQNARSASFLGWLGDTALIATRFGEVTQLHRVTAPLAMRRQLTFGKEPVWDAAVSPNPYASGFIFSRDVGGGEFHQLFWHDLETGAATLLTDGESRYSSVAWAPSGCRFAYTVAGHSGADWDIHTRTLNAPAGATSSGCTVPSAEANIALAGRGPGWFTADWSPDETRLLVIQYVSINESRLFELNLESGALRRLLEDAGTISIRDARYGAGGEDIYLTTDLDAEFVRLHRLHAASGELTSMTGDLAWDVEGFTLSQDATKLAFVANEGGIGRLHVVTLPNWTPVSLPAIPQGLIYSLAFTTQGERLGFVLNRAEAPGDVYAVDFATNTLARWTESELGGLARVQRVAPELISYPTFDDRQIPAFVFRPRGETAPHPVLINIHGGPEGQYRPRFSPTTQFFVNELGLAVIAPNVRGSSGYGKTWLKLDNGYLREDSVRDIGALLDWVAKQEDLDASRVAVIGGSYGGYMVLASLVHFGDQLRAGIDRVGISNFVTFLETTQGYRRELRRAEYGDERDPAMREFLTRISPLNQVERITKPLYISQGLNDPRVPASESDQMVAALKERDVPVWYVVARDEGHGFRKKVNRDYQLAATALFLKHHVLN